MTVIKLRAHHLRILHDYVTRKHNDYLLESKDERVVQVAIDSNHPKEHGLNIVDQMRAALDPKAQIRITDTIDDVCGTCDLKELLRCKEFVPYDVSATSDDRGVAHFYGFKIGKTYSSKYIQRRLKEKGSI